MANSLLIRLMAFGVQITTTGLYIALYTVSEMQAAGNIFPMANCTSEYRYISEMHGWRFEPICFLVGPATAAVPVFLREDLTCAVYKPPVYLSQVHKEFESKAMSHMGLSLADDANSTLDFPGQLSKLDEVHMAAYRDWKFRLFLAFGLVVLVFLLYKFFLMCKRIVPACGDLSRYKEPTYPVNVYQVATSDTGIAVEGTNLNLSSLVGSAPHQEQSVQDSELNASEMNASPRSPKNSSMPHVLGVERGYVEETSSVSSRENLISYMISRQEMMSVKLSLKETGTRTLTIVPVNPYEENTEESTTLNIETSKPHYETSKSNHEITKQGHEAVHAHSKGTSRTEFSIAEEGTGATTLLVEQWQRSEQISSDDCDSLRLTTKPETLCPGHPTAEDKTIEEITGCGHLQQTTVGCQRVDGIHVSNLINGNSAKSTEPGGPMILDTQDRHSSEDLKLSVNCAVDDVSRQGHAKREDLGSSETSHVQEPLRMPDSDEEVELELAAGILEPHRLNSDESGLRKDLDTEGSPGSVAASHTIVERGIDRKVPNVVTYIPAIGSYTDTPAGGEASISSKRRKSKRGKKDLQAAGRKPREAECGKGCKSDKRKKRESEVSNTASTDPFVLPTYHRRPVAELYRMVEESHGNQRGLDAMLDPTTTEEFQKELHNYIQKQNLDIFYPPPVTKDSPIRKLALKAAQRLAESKSMLAGAESAPNTNSFGADQASNTLSSPRTGRHYADICKTALYKTVLLIDDSKSMRDGERYKILTRALERVAELNATIDEDGLSMRFLNYPRRKEHQIPWGLDSIKGVLRMRAILKTNLWKGGTELGGMLLEKVLEPLVFEKARQNQLNKPILISIITDGEPDSENHGRSLQEVIRDCKRRLREQYPHYGENAVAFHITQIGDSPAASNFLDDLAQDPVVGNLIYCTSEHIDDQVRRYDTDSTLQAYNLWWVNELMIAIRG